MTGDPPRTALDSQLRRAVELVRQQPLRWAEGDGGRTAEAVLEGGWFEGAGECARVLAAETRLDIASGGGFGGPWPLLVGGERTLAPAMPVAVGARTESGSDGEYRKVDAAVWREAVGIEEPFLTIDDSQPPPGHPFDLLWFGESERFTLRSGFLEVSDLFGELRVPATADLLEKLLIRGKRLHPSILSTLPRTDCKGPQTIEVRRSVVLSAEERFLDPAAFLAARTDIEHTQMVADRVCVRAANGTESFFDLEEFGSGWKLTARSGSYIFTSIHLERGATTLSVRATLPRDLDGMTPGMRGRLIFDLRSDLVALG